MIFSRPKIIPQEQSIKKPFLFGLANLLLAILALAFFWPSLPPEVPLFYSKPWGDNQLVPSYLLGLPIILSTIVLFANSALAQAAKNQLLIRKMLTVSSATVCVLATITVVRIILLVI